MIMGLIALLKQSRFSHLLLAITFLTSGVILNLIQCTLYYLVRPVNKYLFRKINYYVNYSLYCRKYFSVMNRKLIIIVSGLEKIVNEV